MKLFDVLFNSNSKKGGKGNQRGGRRTILGYRKKKIPAALRQQVWLQRMGRIFEHKCSTTWCSNIITTFDFECGHNLPESKGGKTDISNLIPICRNCNGSMSNTYTFDEWCSKLGTPSSYIPEPMTQPTTKSKRQPRKQKSVEVVHDSQTNGCFSYLRHSRRVNP